MMDPSTLPSWTEIYSRLGGPAPRHRRGRCLIHRGDSPTSVSLDDERGLFHCHVCGAGGDRIDFISKALETDFAGALRFLGLDPGRPPAPDPAIIKRRRVRAGLTGWADNLGRQLRDEHLQRFRIEAYGLGKLRNNPEDDLAWSLLRIAYLGLGQLEEQLDLVDIGTDADRLQVYREWRRA